MTTFPKEALKSALIELAQSDRAFLASLIADLINHPNSGQTPEIKHVGMPALSGNPEPAPAKITPPYRKNVEDLRKKYSMDKAVLLKLQDLFQDGPSAEEFLQTAKP